MDVAVVFFSRARTGALFGEDFVGDGVEFADGLHGGEGLEIGLDLRPFFGVLFCLDRGLWVGVVGDEIVLELEGDDVGGVFGDDGEEFGVGLVGERIAAGLDDVAGVEIAVGDVVVDGVVVGEDETHGDDRVVDALDVEVFGLLEWGL